jgi:uncharacterized membrane protein YjjP (DUF1212 family)
MPRRLLAGAVAYLIASLVAAAIVLGLLGADWQLYPAAAMLVLGLGLLPFLAAIFLLHRIGHTGVVAHALAGLAVSLVAQLLLSPGLLVRPLAMLESWPILVGGATAGAVYWLVESAMRRHTA